MKLSDTLDTRPDRWARHEMDWPSEKYRLAIAHGEGRTMFYIMELEGEYWEVASTHPTRNAAVEWVTRREAIERAT